MKTSGLVLRISSLNSAERDPLNFKSSCLILVSDLLLLFIMHNFTASEERYSKVPNQMEPLFFSFFVNQPETTSFTILPLLLQDLSEHLT